MIFTRPDHFLLRGKGAWYTFPGFALAVVVLAAFLFHPHAAAEEGYPKPSWGTKADFYVSWNDGSDSNPGTLEYPFQTPAKAVGMLSAMQDPSGKIILIRGGLYRWRDHSGNRINIQSLHGKAGAWIQIRGYPGETVILDSFEEDFDPLAEPFNMHCGWGGICVNESSHILIENFEIRGRAQCNVELLNSDFITFRFIEAYRSNKHGLFTGGSFHDLTIEACKFYEQIYGSTASHGVYISGGHWDPALPPVRNITIRYVESYFNGRHGIQFNGRIENFRIEHNNLHHNILGGLSLIGVRKGAVKSNLIYKNNKQGIILYTYFDTAYWDPDDSESVKEWKSTHWTIEDVDVLNNTIFMDDKAWYDDQWINYNPCWHAAICLVDTSELLPPFDDIRIERNLIYNHSKMIVNIVNPEHFAGTSGFKNFCFSEHDPEAVSCVQSLLIGKLEKDFPDRWGGNLLDVDPEFLTCAPTKLIDRTYQAIDFSDPAYTHFNDDFHLENDSQARKVRAGAFLDRYDIAPTLVDTSSSQALPPEYGRKIAAKVLDPKMKPEVLNWFLEIFNPRLDCLKTKHPRDGNDRISFRNDKKKFITFAILNDGADPIVAQTLLEAENNNLAYTGAFGVVFDANLDIKIAPDLQIVENALEYTLGKKSLAIFVVNFHEK